MQLKSYGIGRTDIIKFRHSQIRPLPGYNVRIWTSPDNLAAVEQMAVQIEAAGGLLTPITVTLGKDGANTQVVYILDGETRWRAVGLLIERGKATDETYVFTAQPELAGRNDVQRDYDLFHRNDGRQISALEAAALVSRLIARNRTEAEIAQGLGQKLSFVNYHLTLASADTALHDLILAGKVKPTTVVNAWREHGGAATKLILETLAAKEAEHEAEIEAAEEIATAPAAVGPAPAVVVPDLGDVVPLSGRSRTVLKPSVVKRGGRKALTETEKAARAAAKLSAATVRVTGSDLVRKREPAINEVRYNCLRTFVEMVAGECWSQEWRDMANDALDEAGHDRVPYMLKHDASQAVDEMSEAP